MSHTKLEFVLFYRQWVVLEIVVNKETRCCPLVQCISNLENFCLNTCVVRQVLSFEERSIDLFLAKTNIENNTLIMQFTSIEV